MWFSTVFFRRLIAVAFAVPVAVLLITLLIPTGVLEWWRSVYPLPPVPPRTPVYTVTHDIGTTTDTYLGFRRYPEVVLRDNGTVRESRNETDLPSDDLEARFRKRTGFVDKSGAERGSTRIISLASSGYALTTRNLVYERYVSGMTECWQWDGVIPGYENTIYRSARLRKINRHGTVIGSGRIDTNRSSCTRPYYGHGRRFGIIWRTGHAKPSDINSLVAQSSGWYIDAALDITDRGQILCLARRAGKKGSDWQSTAPHHLIVLSPANGAVK